MTKNKAAIWDGESEQLFNQMDKWRENYVCQANCDEWQDWKFCKHLVKARTKKFSKEINLQLKKLFITSNSV